ncbi:MAG: nicotinamide-nucleotide adenylyltransferase [Nitrososphaerales archaeon]
MKYGILVGRFQPFHLGHLKAVKFAMSKVDMLWIIIGSAQKSHEPRNPFTAGERLVMIKMTLDGEKVNPKKWLAVPVNDVNDHSRWTDQIDLLIPRYDVVFTNDPFSTMLFRKHKKKVVKVPMLKRKFLSATEVRKRIASGKNWKELVPKQVAEMIMEINGVNRIKLMQPS